MPQTNPTKESYGALLWAYDIFNRELFNDALPPCVITMQTRRKKALGIFKKDSWKDHQEKQTASEITLNPDWFSSRSTAEVLSTLGHEMVHFQQHCFGKPSRGSYHNKEWAQMMRNIGLIPSDTARPGGKETGPSVSHYIEEGGKFQRVCQEILGTGFTIPWHTILKLRAGQGEEDSRALQKKRASKTKYSCPSCTLNVWAKPQVRILCVDCQCELSHAI